MMRILKHYLEVVLFMIQMEFAIKIQTISEETVQERNQEIQDIT